MGVVIPTWSQGRAGQGLVLGVWGKTSGIVEGKLKAREDQRPPGTQQGCGASWGLSRGALRDPEDASGPQELCGGRAPWMASPHCPQSSLRLGAFPSKPTDARTAWTQSQAFRFL